MGGVCGTDGVTDYTMGIAVVVHGAFNDTGIAIKTTSADTSIKFMQFRDNSNNTRGAIGSSSSLFNTSATDKCSCYI